MTCVDFFRFAACPGNSPDGLFGAGGIAGGIGKLSRGIFPAAASVDEHVAIGGKAERREFLAVVFEIRSESAALEVRSFRNPDVALALFIERPGDAIASLGRNEIGWKRSAEDLLEREAILCVRSARGKKDE